MTNTTLLVSFCNRPENRGDVLAIVDAGSGEHRWLNFGACAPASACGIAFGDGVVFCACSDENGSYVAIFDASLEIREIVRLANVSDIHSICVDGDSIIAVSSGTDEVLRLTIDNLAGDGEVLWRAGSQRADEHHLNSVAFVRGQLLCSAFGRRTGETWGDACDGFLYDVTAGAYVIRGVYHPHSVAEHIGELYFCESAESCLRGAGGPLRYVGGYARGLAFGPDGQCYVGSSLGRRPTALSRFVLNPSDPGTRAGRCAISVGMLSDRSGFRTVDLSHAAEEIYDIAVVNGSSAARKHPA